ncbi:MAG: hypothetical protein KA328_00575 [Sulfurospirillum sp.]|nr:hypothetical protein [Sulfurospirillum sp.]MBP9612601.1 hypothetical protein [Sulfurospirillum sp.]
MLLYTQNGHFLGMGSQELSWLGYEDMEDFRTYHSDVADLFIQKPGYISKFDTFSWIDYARHSGTSNRRVLLHNKQGKCIELSLHVDEIFLKNPDDAMQCYFTVELKNDLPLEDTVCSSSLHVKTLCEEKASNETPLLPSEYSSIDQIKLDDIVFDSTMESYPEDAHEDLLQDPTLCASPEAPFNLHATAQILGLNATMLHVLLDEYYHELLTQSDAIAQWILEGTSQKASAEILKLKSLALQFRLYTLYHSFNALQRSLEEKNQAVTQHHLAEVQDAIKALPSIIEGKLL